MTRATVESTAAAAAAAITITMDSGSGTGVKQVATSTNVRNLLLPVQEEEEDKRRREEAVHTLLYPLLLSAVSLASSPRDLSRTAAAAEDEK